MNYKNREKRDIRPKYLTLYSGGKGARGSEQLRNCKNLWPSFSVTSKSSHGNFMLSLHALKLLSAFIHNIGLSF